MSNKLNPVGFEPSTFQWASDAQVMNNADNNIIGCFLEIYLPIQHYCYKRTYFKNYNTKSIII